MMSALTASPPHRAGVHAHGEGDQHLFNKPHPQYTEARAPLLEEVLELLKPTGLHINIELKNSRLPYEGLNQPALNW